MIEQVSQSRAMKPQPFAYSVRGGVVSRILRFNAVLAAYPLHTRQVFTAAQLAKIGAQS